MEILERDLHQWHNESAVVFSKSLKDKEIPLERRDDLIEIKFYDTCTGVHFLHRTALDFFTDSEQGKVFLEQNSSGNSHPQVLYVKALLADLVVFPNSTEDYQTPKTIAWIMKNICVAEEKTEVAQSALMELLDRNISALCRRSGQPSNTHWCRAWGYPEKYYSLGARPLTGGISTTGPIDFLGFAAWCGLYKYIERTLDLYSERRTPALRTIYSAVLWPVSVTHIGHIGVFITSIGTPS